MSFHGLFLGETGSGKTFKARQLAATFKASGVPVLALVPPGHAWTEAAWQTNDVGAFVAKANASRRCALFMEFADADADKFDDGLTRLFTWSRNYGHRAFAICQRHTQVNPTIRDQCRFLWLFRVGAKTAGLLAEEYVEPLLVHAPTLPDYHFFFKKRGTPATLHAPNS